MINNGISKKLRKTPKISFIMTLYVLSETYIVQVLWHIFALLSLSDL